MASRDRTGTIVWLVVAVAALGLDRVVAAGDISALDQHFNRPGRAIAPWMFVPAGNIKEFSTEEHPGLATIWRAGVRTSRASSRIRSGSATTACPGSSRPRWSRAST